MPATNMCWEGQHAIDKSLSISIRTGRLDIAGSQQERMHAMKKAEKILSILFVVILIGSVLTRTSFAKAEFTLELDASHGEGTLNLNFALGTPEEALWANCLILTYPAFQVIPLWSVPLPVIDPPIDLPISFPLPSGLGTVGIWTGLFTVEGAQAVDLEWVHTGIDVQSNLPDTGIDFCYDGNAEIPCPDPGEPFYGQDAQYVTNPMSFTDHGDGTVTDNITGLMWQQEDTDRPKYWDEAIDYCEALTLAGHADWRLPDEYELQSIVNYGRSNPSIDTTY